MSVDVHNVARRPLRVAVLAEGSHAPRWLMESIASALTVPEVIFVGWFRFPAPGASSLVEDLFGILDRWDGRLFCARAPAFELLSIADHLGQPALGSLSLHREGAVLVADLKSLQSLAALDLDLLLCCTSLRLRLPPGIARQGAWAIEIGFGVPALAPWSGAAEVAAGSEITAIRVVDYGATEARELYCSCIATVHKSVRRSRLVAVDNSLAVFRRLVAGLIHGNLEPPRILPLPADYPRQAHPSLALLLKAVGRIGAANLNSRLGRNDDGDLWHIAFCFTDQELPAIPFDRLRYLAPPPGRFWADPFPLILDGHYYILFEELAFANWRGRLLAVEVFESGEASAPMLVLERDHHLSYPFLFRWQDELYMIPETCSRRRVELLRCAEFPGRWETVKILLDDLRAADATLWECDGGWWMFVNVAAGQSDNINDLHLYFADSPVGDWQPHPANPICSDVRCARPAGPLFEAGGRLFRPSQDSAQDYGRAIWINRIEQLNRQFYREAPVLHIPPDWRADCTRAHTLGRAGRLTVLDCALRNRERT